MAKKDKFGKGIDAFFTGSEDKIKKATSPRTKSTNTTVIDNEPKVRTSIYFTESELEKLRAYAYMTRTKQAILLRKAVKSFLKTIEEDMEEALKIYRNRPDVDEGDID
jgi:hypothetical protein